MGINTRRRVAQGDRPLTRADIERLLQRAGSSERLVLDGRNLQGIDLTGLRLQGVHFNGANLHRAKLRGADLAGAEFRGADLSFADLTETHLQRADFRDGLRAISVPSKEAHEMTFVISGANLRGANLSSADLSEANLIGVDLSSASLGKAILRGAFLERTILSLAQLFSADWHGTDLHQALLSLGDLMTVSDLLSFADPTKGTNDIDSLTGAAWGSDLDGRILVNALLHGASVVKAASESQNASLEPAPTFRIRIIEEPLTPTHLLSALSAITELATKCWLIAQERFADLIQYTQTHDKQFVEESQLRITRMSYNSPFDASFKIDLSASNVAEGIVTALDGITQVKQKLRKAELENEAKSQEITEARQKAEREEQAALVDLERQALAVERERLDLLEKQLEVQKKAVEYALEIASRTVAVLRPDADEQVKAMLIQTLLPTLLQASNIKGLELVLLPRPKDDTQQKELSK